MTLTKLLLVLALALSPALSLAESQPMPEPMTEAEAKAIAPADVPRGQADYHAAGEGHYVLDPAHTAVLARVPHMGFSVSVLRFDQVEATLDWNPEDPASSSLEARVQAASISHPYPGFDTILQGADYLNTEANPEATFLSTEFIADSDTKGQVKGDLTIMGQTHPATFEVTLVGAGEGFTGDENGNPIIANLIGMQAVTMIDPQAYGLNPFFTDPIEIQIDAEFARKPAPEAQP